MGAVVGRETALADATGFVEAVAAGPAALLIEGTTGIGKTTVWQAACAAARDSGACVLAATALDLEADLPFVVLRDLLEPVPADTVAALPAAQAHALEVALLRIAADPSGVADQHAVSVAVLGVVRALAAQRPLVIAVDDVGWLDSSSERVLRYVLRRVTTEPVGVLLAQRPAAAPEPPLGLDGPPFAGRLRRVGLGPLDADQTHVLLTERAGLPLTRRLGRSIHRAAAGNPFYAVEIGRAVQRAGARVLNTDALPLPSGVLAVTRERLAALSPNARHVLVVAATLSAPTVALIAAAVGEATAEALDEAVDEGLLTLTSSHPTGPTGVTFTHPLLRTAAATTLTARGRQELNRRLATIVTDPDERAGHLAAGASGPDEAIATELDGAASRAFTRGAPDAAADIAAKAAALTPPGSAGQAKRAVACGEYRYRAEDIEAAASGLTDTLAHLPPGELRAEALLWLFYVRQAQNAMAEAVELGHAALAEEPGPALRAAIERDLAYAHVIDGDPTTADGYAAAALRTARSGDDPVSIAESQTTLAWTQFWVGRGLRTDLLAVTRTRTTWTRYMPHGASPNALAAMLLSWADQLDDARAALQAEDNRLTELGHDRPRLLVLFTRSELECRAGRWDAALRHAEEGLRTTELTGDTFYGALVRYSRGMVLAHRGRLDAARADAEQVIAVGRAGRAAVAVQFGAALLGFVELSLGNHEAVDRQLGPFAAAVPASGAYDPGLARFLPDEIEALTRLGRPDRAEELLDPFEAQAVALDRPWALGAAGRCRALLHAVAGDLAAALVTVDAALSAHDRVSMPFERARTLLVAGSIRRRARRPGARAALAESLAVFTGLGSPAWAARAQEELDRTGGRAGPAPSALTGTEHRIAELVVAGHSNKEVAAALFLTPATVESALWTIYRKLGVRSRSELAARLKGARTT